MTMLLRHLNLIFLLKPDNLVLFHLPILPDSYDHTDTSIMRLRLVDIYYRIGLLLNKTRITSFPLIYLLSC
jgi:hypothetical protein